MAKSSATKVAVEDVVMETKSDAVETMNENTKKTAEKTIKEEPLNKFDEIKVVSLIVRTCHNSLVTSMSIT